LALGVGAFNCDVTEKLCYVTVSFSVHFALCPPHLVSGYLVSPPFVLFVFFLYDFALFMFFPLLMPLLYFPIHLHVCTEKIKKEIKMVLNKPWN